MSWVGGRGWISTEQVLCNMGEGEVCQRLSMKNLNQSSISEEQLARPPISGPLKFCQILLFVHHFDDYRINKFSHKLSDDWKIYYSENNNCNFVHSNSTMIFTVHLCIFGMSLRDLTTVF
jgi:hypothetical protein